MAVKYFYSAASINIIPSTSSVWYNGSGGTGGLSGAPTAADDVIFDNLSLPAGNTVGFVPGSSTYTYYYKSLSFKNPTTGGEFAGNIGANMSGSGAAIINIVGGNASGDALVLSTLQGSLPSSYLTINFGGTGALQGNYNIKGAGATVTSKSINCKVNFNNPNSVYSIISDICFNGTNIGIVVFVNTTLSIKANVYINYNIVSVYGTLTSPPITSGTNNGYLLTINAFYNGAGAANYGRALYIGSITVTTGQVTNFWCNANIQGGIQNYTANTSTFSGIVNINNQLSGTLVSLGNYAGALIFDDVVTITSQNYATGKSAEITSGTMTFNKAFSITYPFNINGSGCTVNFNNTFNSSSNITLTQGNLNFNYGSNNSLVPDIKCTTFNSPQSFTASCTGTTLTTVGSPTLSAGSVIKLLDGTTVGTIVSGSANTWTISSPGGTYVSQLMYVANSNTRSLSVASTAYWELTNRWSTPDLTNMTINASGSFLKFTGTALNTTTSIISIFGNNVTYTGTPNPPTPASPVVDLTKLSKINNNINYGTIWFNRVTNGTNTIYVLGSNFFEDCWDGNPTVGSNYSLPAHTLAFEQNKINVFKNFNVNSLLGVSGNKITLDSCDVIPALATGQHYLCSFNYPPTLPTLSPTSNQIKLKNLVIKHSAVTPSFNPGDDVLTAKWSASSTSLDTTTPEVSTGWYAPINKYWVGTGTWTTTNKTNWSDTPTGSGGDEVPTADNNVFFTGSGTCTIASAAVLVCKSISFEGFTGTLTSGTATNPVITVGDSGKGSFDFGTTTWTNLYKGTFTLVNPSSTDIFYINNVNGNTASKILQGNMVVGLSTGDNTQKYVFKEFFKTINTASLNITSGDVTFNKTDTAGGKYNASVGIMILNTSAASKIVNASSGIELTGGGDTAGTNVNVWQGDGTNASSTWLSLKVNNIYLTNPGTTLLGGSYLLGNTTVPFTNLYFNANGSLVGTNSAIACNNIFVNSASVKITFGTTTVSGSVDFTGSTGKWDQGTLTNVLTIGKDLTIASGMAVLKSSYLTFSSAGGNNLITANSKSFSNPIVVDSGANVTFTDATTTSTSTVTLNTGGTLTLKNLTATGLIVNGGTLITSSLYTIILGTGTITLGAGAPNVVINSTLNCGSLNSTAGKALTLNGPVTLSSAASINVTGLGASLTFNDTLTTTTGTIILNGDSAILEFKKAVNCSNSISLLQGSLYIKDNVTCTTFTSSGTATRKLEFTNGSIPITITLTGFTTVATSSVWSLSPGTSLTTTGLDNNVTIKLTSTNNVTTNYVTFDGGGLSYDTVWWNRIGVTTSNYVKGTGNTYKLFKDGNDYSGGSAVLPTIDIKAHQIIFDGGSTHTFTNFKVNGLSNILITITTNPALSTANCIFTSTNTTAEYINCYFINILKNTALPSILPDYVWVAYSSTKDLVTTGWKIVNSRYWVPNGDGDWGSSTNWSTKSAGAGGTSGAAAPTNSDVAIFDAFSGTGNVNINVASTCLALRFTGDDGLSNSSVKVIGTGALSILKELILSPSMTMWDPLTSTGYTGTITFAGESMSGNYTITSNGVQINCPIVFNPTITSSSWKFTDYFNSLKTVTLTKGIITFAGANPIIDPLTGVNYNATIANFSSSGTGIRRVNAGVLNTISGNYENGRIELTGVGNSWDQTTDTNLITNVDNLYVTGTITGNNKYIAGSTTVPIKTVWFYGKADVIGITNSNSKIGDIYVRTIGTTATSTRFNIAQGSTIGSLDFGGTVSSTFTGSITGNVLTVTSITSEKIGINDLIRGSGISNNLNVVIDSQSSGTPGGVGDYVLSYTFPTPLASTSITAYANSKVNWSVGSSNTGCTLTGNLRLTASFSAVSGGYALVGGQDLTFTPTNNISISTGYWTTGGQINTFPQTVTITAPSNSTVINYALASGGFVLNSGTVNIGTGVPVYANGFLVANTCTFNGGTLNTIVGSLLYDSTGTGAGTLSIKNGANITSLGSTSFKNITVDNGSTLTLGTPSNYNNGLLSSLGGTITVNGTLNIYCQASNLTSSIVVGTVALAGEFNCYNELQTTNNLTLTRGDLTLDYKATPQNFRGYFTPITSSPGSYPTNGSGVGGIIQKGDYWLMKNSGYVGTTAVIASNSAQATVNNPTDLDWNIGNILNNINFKLNRFNSSNTNVRSITIGNGSRIELTDNTTDPDGSPVWNVSLTSIALSNASCTGTTLTTTNSPSLVPGMIIYSSTTGDSLGEIISGSANTWTVSIGGTFNAQPMVAMALKKLDATGSIILLTGADASTYYISFDGGDNITGTGANPIILNPNIKYSNLIFNRTNSIGNVYLYGSNVFQTFSDFGAINNPSSPQVGHTLYIEAGSINIFNNAFNVNGVGSASTERIILNSTSASIPHNLILGNTADVTQSYYLDVRNSSAFPTSPVKWYARESLNGGGNTGWNFASVSRYWVPGGNNNWNSATNWAEYSNGPSGASVPTATIPAIFDENSGTGVCVINTTATCLDFDCANFGGTFSRVYGNVMTMYGDVTLGTSFMSLNNSGGGTYINLNSATPGKINKFKYLGTSSQLMITGFKFYGPGEWNLDSGLYTSGGINVHSGIFDTKSYDIITDNFTYSLIGTAYNAITINLNNSTITLKGAGDTWYIPDAAASYVTLNTSTSTIEMTESTAGAGTAYWINFYGGGKSYNKVRFNRGTNAGRNRFYGTLPLTIYELSDLGTANHFIDFVNGGDYTFNDIILNTVANPIVTFTSTFSIIYNFHSTNPGKIFCNNVTINFCKADECKFVATGTFTLGSGTTGWNSTNCGGGLLLLTGVGK
jgi:hypothetical protein